MTDDPAVAIDYKALLIKYIRHVEAHEGVTFIGTDEYYRKYSSLPDTFFTDKEWDILKELHDIAASLTNKL